MNIIEGVIRCTGIKNRFTSQKKINSILDKNKKNKEYKILNFKFKSNINKEKINDNDIYHFYKKENETVIIYLHGGAYVNNPLLFHLLFIDKIVDNSDIDVYLPIYPLAPNYTYKEAYDFLLTCYKKLLKKGKKIILMGDSAGGGLALGFSLFLKEKEITQPYKLVLISPWLDVTMSNKNIKEYEKKDPILASYGLVEIGKVWANELDLKDYKVSPIYADFKGLPDILLFTGNREIFYPDIILLNKKLKRSNVKTKLIIGENMQHIYPLYRFKERKKALLEIYKFIDK